MMNSTADNNIVSVMSDRVDLDTSQGVETLQETNCREGASVLFGLRTAKDAKETERKAFPTKVDDGDQEFEIPKRFTRSGRKRAVSFPLKLMKVLSCKQFAHIITWMPSGKAWNVLKPKDFVAKILPDYFKSAKYSSFTRKLHRWGFARHYKGEEAGAFFHKDFQKDRIDLVEKMTCKKDLKSFVGVDEALRTEIEANHSGSASTLNRALEQGQSSLPRKTLSPAIASGVSSAMPMTSNVPVCLSQGALITEAFSRPTPVIPKHERGGLQQIYDLPSLYLNLSDMTSNGSIVAAKINAAIELEVCRRLQERNKNTESLMSQRPLWFNGILTSLPHVQPSIGLKKAVAPSSSTLQEKMLHHMQQQKVLLQYLALTGKVPMPSHGLGQLPKTNIQGAKTA